MAFLFIEKWKNLNQCILSALQADYVVTFKILVDKS